MLFTKKQAPLITVIAIGFVLMVVLWCGSRRMKTKRSASCPEGVKCASVSDIGVPPAVIDADTKQVSVGGDILGAAIRAGVLPDEAAHGELDGQLQQEFYDAAPMSADNVLPPAYYYTPAELNGFKEKGQAQKPCFASRPCDRLTQHPPVFSNVAHHRTKGRGPACVHCKCVGDVKAAMATDAVLLVYANGCPPCEAFKPIYFATAPKSSIPFYAVEGHAVPEVTTLLPLEGFPTVFRVRNGAVIGVFDGPRTELGLLNWIR